MKSRFGGFQSLENLNNRLRRFRFVISRFVDSSFAGGYGSIFRGSGLEFQAVRHYVLGDDIRFIDWNVSSRLGGTYCKIFNEERDINLMFLLDISSSMVDGLNSGKFRLLKDIFAVFGFAALSNGDKIGSMAFDENVSWFMPAKSGSSYFVEQLKRVFSLGNKKQFSGSDLSNALRVLSETMKRRGTCIIISDFKTEHYWKELTLLSRRHEVIAILVDDIWDKNRLVTGSLVVRDAEESQVLHFFPKSPKFQKMYTEYWSSFQARWKQNCRRMGVDTVVINTRDDILVTLLSFLRKRRKERL